MKLLNRLSPKHIILIISVVYITGYFAHATYLHKTVYGDGMYYWAWLTSGTPSKFSVGPALFWAPVYILTHNEIAVGVTGVLAALFALILLFHLLMESFSKTVSIMTIAAVAGATNLLFYGSLDTVNSHALSFFAAVVFLVLLTKTRQWIAIGASLGFLGMIRMQDFLFGLLLIPFISKRNILLILTGIIVAFLPQLAAWQLVSGKFWMSPYLLHETFDFSRPHILGVLLSPSSGLFLWTPITIFGVIGLFTSRRYWFTALFILELYAVASWSTWWQGASYSGRMFVSSLPVLAFGVAAVFSWLSKFRFTQAHYLVSIVGPLILLNATSIIYFLLTLPGR